jgi:DNA modification methylase
MISLINADARKIPLRDKSVQCVATSPPYFRQRDYSQNDQIGTELDLLSYIAAISQVFVEVRRVLRDDGVVWLNLGNKYASSGGSRPNGSSDMPVQSGEHVAGLRRPQNGYKRGDLIGVPWLMAVALQAQGWWLRSDVIWCLSAGTRVYVKSQKGVMPMTIKDMVRLDPATVQLWNGVKWTQVLGWNKSPEPENPIKIILRSGERINCTANHRWPTQRGVIRADELQVGDVIRKTRLPGQEKALEPAHLPSDSVGWFVGMYLAAGSRSKRVIQISSHVKELERYALLQQIASEYGGSCARYKTSENGVTINLYGKILNAIIDTYIGGKTAKDKHLSVACWQRRDDFLRSVLQGYLEGDGHYSEKNNRWRLGFTRNYNLEADLRTLCARLGIQLRLKPKMTGKHKTFKGEIRFTKSNHFNAKDDGEVVGIGRAQRCNYWDIGVADEPHLFALASGVLTHNSKPNAMPDPVKGWRFKEKDGELKLYKGSWRPSRSHEYVFMLAKSQKYYADGEPVREKPAGYARKGGSAPYLANGSTTNGKNSSSFHQMNPNGANKRSVWSIPTVQWHGQHCATFPPDLIEPCLKSSTPAGGCCAKCEAPYARVGYSDEFLPTCEHGKKAGKKSSLVLDPFVGTGTTLQKARELGLRGVGLDLNLDYLAEDARNRLGFTALDSWKNGIKDTSRPEMAMGPLFIGR